MGKEELETFVARGDAAFGLRHDQSELTRRSAGVEVDRCVAVIEGGEIVGTASVISLEVTLPGLTSARAAGVANVGVLPTHRRRGLLVQMMRHQLDEAHARGEPIALLTASEGGIYGRFGFGPATFQATYRIRRGGALRPEPASAAEGSLWLTEPSAAAGTLPEVFEDSRRARPGDVGRPPDWWEDLLADDDRKPDGSGALFCVIRADPGGTVDGYALYRVDPRGAGDDGAAGLVRVRELCAASRGAYSQLWAFLCDIDLTAALEAPGRPLDEPLRWLLADGRQLRLLSCEDHIWARLVDVGAALEARRFRTSGSLLIEVTDAFCPWNSGTWRLDGGPGGAEAGREDGTGPDLSMEARDLASAYLGGVRLSSLGRAGRVVEHRRGSMDLADAMFSSDPPPFCASSF